RLPEGERDPSYGQNMRQPSFYAMIAGPLRLQDVLSKALADRDPALAVDAIDALARTAGTNALINRGAGVQPLLRALQFPDRRVRYHAALALGQALPENDYEGSQRVVPVLAEAIRQTANRYAM